MGVYNELVDGDALWERKSRPEDAIIVNDMSNVTAAERDAFNAQIYTKYSPDDILSNLPHCLCNEIVGEPDLGVLCTTCNTVVEHRSSVMLESIVWIRAPKGVKALINPMVLTMLSNHFKKGTFDTIRYLTDPSYRYEKKTPAILLAIETLNIPRGYNNFIDRFDEILDKLLELKDFRMTKRTATAELRQLLRDQRAAVFSTYLPIPNKTLLVLEKSNQVNFTDETVVDAVDAIRTLVGIDTPQNVLSNAKREIRTIKCLFQLQAFYKTWTDKVAAAKPGIYRKHTVAGRCDYSFRGVISSLSDQHHYDEVHIPWGIATSVFQLHLCNKLKKMGYTPNESLGLLNAYAHRYSPILAGLFEELIKESPYIGVPIVLGRNPSLKRGSMQQLFITKVKTDVSVRTISLSVLVLRELNADGHV